MTDIGANMPPRARTLARSGGALRVAVSRHAFDACIVTALAVLCLWQWLPGIGATPMHRDEARWIHRAEYLREVAHPLGDYWDEDTWIAQGGTMDERNRLRAQPPLGSYVMGIGLLLQGRDLDVNGFWNMDRDDAWNAAQGNLPARSDLLAARRTTAIVATLTVLAVYAIGTRLTNRAGGLAGAVYFALHPLLGILAVFAGSDTLLVLLLALAAVAAWRFADRPSWPRVLLLGVLLGLGAATKLSPLAVAIPFGLLGIAVLMARWLTPVRILCGGAPGRVGWQLFSVPLVAGIVFVTSYPYLWRAPLAHTQALFDYRATGMELQGSIWTHISVESPAEAIDRVLRRLGEDLTVSGRFGADLGTFELAIAVAGLALWVALAVRRGLTGAYSLTFAVLGGAAVVTVAGMRVDWARYHLPILVFGSVCIAVAVGWVWSVVRAWRLSL